MGLVAGRVARACLALACVGLWVGTARAADAPDQVGQWSKEVSWPNTDTHSHLLPTGKVMFIGEFDAGMDGPYVWDPVTDTLSQLTAPPYNIFCAGESFLGDGMLLFTGGHDMTHVGLPYAVLFNPYTGAWTRLPDMNDKRWYPTTVTLPDGRGISLSGETDAAETSDGLPQIWDPDGGKWVDLTNAVLHLPYYPRTFVAPDGRLFVAGPQALSRYLDTAGVGAWVNGPRTVSPASRTYGSAVMYEPGKVLVVGGGSPPLASAEIIDLTAPTPAWHDTDPMHFARRQQNATLLPDGRVLVTGGSSGADFDDTTAPVLVSEVWDPATGHWTEWAPQASYHGYHSTATLLPDGRVQMGGGRMNRLVQVFSPPYLFKGPRPTLTSAPKDVMPGQTFALGTPDAASIAQVTLVRLTAVTHAFNMNQRFNRLSFVRSSNGLTVTAPADNDLAPPGDYLLFLINGTGVPSIAKILRVDRAPDPLTHAIVFSDTWRYDDTGVDPGTTWRQGGYDDSAWKVGRGQLGFGDGDEATVVARNGPTLYLRKQITVSGPVSTARLDLLVDDGAAVWVNGTQVFAKNMGNGTGHASFASATVTNQFYREAIPSSAFVQGVNTIAVEVKQVSATSPDLSFALALDLKVDTAPDASLGTACREDGDCGASASCFRDGAVTGICVQTCGDTGATCADGTTCQTPSASEPQVCLSGCPAQGCDPGQTCTALESGTVCVPGCAADADCRSGDVCSAGLCVAASPSAPDAGSPGTPSSAPDAGVPQPSAPAGDPSANLPVAPHSGCDVGGGASWLALAAVWLGGLAFRRRRRKG